MVLLIMEKKNKKNAILYFDKMSTSQEKNDDSRDESQELIHLQNSHQNLMKRTLINNFVF